MRLLVALVLLFVSVCRGEELADGYVESFERHLKQYSHALLVCTYHDYTVDDPGNDLYERLYEEATVVRVFKGNSKVSQKVKFFRLIEGKPKLKSKANGELTFVFFDEMPDGELLLGTGDGFPFHPQFLRLAEAWVHDGKAAAEEQSETSSRSK